VSALNNLTGLGTHFSACFLWPSPLYTSAAVKPSCFRRGANRSVQGFDVSLCFVLGFRFCSPLLFREIRLAAADKKSPSKRVAGKAKAISSLRPTKRKTRPASAATQAPDEQATKELTPETRNVATQDRSRRSIHKRRLLDAELKAGEKWKRHLCKAAR
jgi:hypothetical protein